MKLRIEIIISFLLLSVFSQLTLAANYYQYCTDTDNGLKYDISGKVYISYNKNPTESEKQGMPDVCHQGGAVVQSCTGSTCYIGEYACVKGSGEYWDIQYDSKKCTDLGYTGCADGACYGKPVVETCSDGKKNQDETDIDCGGVCGATCGTTQGCKSSKDCKSGICGENTCKEAIKIEPYCLDEDNGNINTNAKLKFGYYEYDGRWNEGYVTEDCVAGDSIITRCEANANGGCFVREAVCDSSQQSKYTFKKVSCAYGCENGACKSAPPTQTCSDGIKNQDESDVDCGGVICNKCDAGKKCFLSSDCRSSLCENRICSDSSCRDTDGDNIYTKGSATGYNRLNAGVLSWGDHCAETTSGASTASGRYVYEAICRNNEVAYKEVQPCPENTWCEDGACKPARITVTTADSQPQATAVPVEEAQPVQVQAESRYVTVRTDDSANQATPVQVEENHPIVVQAEQPSRGENVVVQEEETQTRLPNPEGEGWGSRAFGFFRNVFSGRSNRESISTGVGCDNLCGQIRTVRESLAQRIIDLENAVNWLRQTEIKRIAKEEIKEQMSSFLASCESEWVSGFSGIRQYGTCNNYCKEAENKICLTSIKYSSFEIGDSDYEGPRYPVYRSVGCSYQYNSATETSLFCICCSFPSE